MRPLRIVSLRWENQQIRPCTSAMLRYKLAIPTYLSATLIQETGNANHAI